MALHPRATRVLSLGVVLLLVACGREAPCDESTCGALGGVVTAVAQDGTTAWRTPVRDSGARVLRSGTALVVDGCRATTVLDAATGRVLLETEDVEEAGAVVDGLLVGSARDDDDGPAVVGRRLDGAAGGFTWSSTSGTEDVVPSPITVVGGSGFAVAWGDSVSVVPRAAERGGRTTDVQLPSEARGPLATLGEDTVAVAGRDGSVYGVRGGALVWRVLPDEIAVSVDTRFTPVAGGVLVSWTGRDSTETALVEGTGDVRWRAPGIVLEGEVVAEDAPVVVLLAAGGTAGHDLATGARLWTAPEPVDGRTHLSTRSVVATSETGAEGDRVVGRDPRTGEVRWERDGWVAGPSGEAALLTQGGSPADEARVSALDAATGDVLWTLGVGKTFATSAVVLASGASGALTVVADVPDRPMVMCE